MTGDQLRALAARHAFTLAAGGGGSCHDDCGALLALLREVQRQIAHRKQAVRVPAHPCPLCAGIGEHSKICIAPVLEVLHDR